MGKKKASGSIKPMGLSAKDVFKVFGVKSSDVQPIGVLEATSVNRLLGGQSYVLEAKSTNLLLKSDPVPATSEDKRPIEIQKDVSGELLTKDLEVVPALMQVKKCRF